MGVGGILLAGRTAADDGADADERGAPFLLPGGAQGPVDGVHAAAVRHGLDMPSAGLEAHSHVFAPGEGRRSGQADAVVVVQNDQLAQAEVSGERTSLGRDALHEIPVAGQHVGEVIDDGMTAPVVPGRQMGFRDGHAHGAADPLPQGARRHLHAGRAAIFRVAGRPAPPLPERPDIVEAEIVAGQEKHGVQQHGTVPGREHHPVPVRPLRVGRVVSKVSRPERVGDRRRPHGQAGMPRLCTLHGVDGKKTDGVDALLLGIQRIGHAASPFCVRKCVCSVCLFIPSDPIRQAD